MARKAKVAPAAAASGGTLQQIAQLRSFCGDSFSDYDLTDCLRQCSYNLERAATLLMTGEYKKPKRGKNSSSSSAAAPIEVIDLDSTTSSLSQTASFKLSQSNASKPPANLSWSNRRQPKQKPSLAKKTPAKSSPKLPVSSTVTPTPSGPSEADLANSWLLCERWISNAYSTTVRASIDYQESLTCTVTSPHQVRFVGRKVEGNLPTDLALFLAPLLSCHAINIKARSLEGATHLPTGRHIALSLQISLQLETFFGLFVKNEKEKKTSLFLQKHAAAPKRKKTLTPAQSAFDLLQWAQYGPDVVKYRTDEENSKADTKSSDSTDEELETTAIEDDDSDENENETNQLILEQLGGDPALPEAPNPEGLNAALRPYQKQALHWMLQRESNSETHAMVQKRLDFLSELVGTSNKNTSRSGEYLPGTQRVECDDCGPVKVSKDIWESCTQHPLWKLRFLTKRGKVQAFYVHEILQVATLLPPRPPQPCSGGILADQMGLGKTVMLMALLLQDKKIIGRQKNATTLVVAKLSLLPQWQQEIESKTNLTHAIFYGNSNRLPDLAGADVVLTTYGTLQADFTNKRILQDFAWHRVILDEAHSIRNRRTVAAQAACDLEAKHRWCVSGTVVQNSLEDVLGLLQFLRHEPWCLPPFWKAAISDLMNATVAANETSEDKEEERQKNVALALDRVRRVLSPIMLRRTKDSLAGDGKPILTLPPKEIETIKVELSGEERDFYNALLARSQDIFDGFVQSGKASTSYLQIFGLLQRLRQVCDHIALTAQSRFNNKKREATKGTSERDATDGAPVDTVGKEFLEGLLDKFCSKHGSSPRKQKRGDEDESDEDTPSKKARQVEYVSQVAEMLKTIVTDPKATHLNEECAICLDAPAVEDAVLTPCAHIFCRNCLVGHMRKRQENANASISCPDGPCPNCNKEVRAKRIIALTRTHDGTVTSRFLTKSSTSKPSRMQSTQEGNQGAMARQILENAIQGTESSKMKAIVAELHKVWEVDPGSKALLFSHYLGFLDLLELRFRRDGIPYFRLDGSLSLQERMSVLEQFRTAQTPKGAVLLMSMTAGAEGLNLVSASSCFICDPWWNQAKEDQCVNRIHRIGQMASVVRIRKFVVTNSVEERIVELQNRKKYVADEIYNNRSNPSGKSSSSARLGLEEFRMIFRR